MKKRESKYPTNNFLVQAVTYSLKMKTPDLSSAMSAPPLSFSSQLLRLELRHSKIAQKFYGCSGKNEMVIMTMVPPL